MSKAITLYAATQNVLGSTNPRFIYFETIQERNAFVKATDCTAKAGTVKVTTEQFAQWKALGVWDHYAN